MMKLPLEDLLNLIDEETNPDLSNKLREAASLLSALTLIANHYNLEPPAARDTIAGTAERLINGIRRKNNET